MYGIIIENVIDLMVLQLIVKMEIRNGGFVGSVINLMVQQLNMQLELRNGGCVE
jgi:hypothetical protein